MTTQARARQRRFAGDDARRRAARQYRDGVEVPEIAAQFGVSQRTVYRWVRWAGVPYRMPYWQQQMQHD